jgi:LacI family transcriptional regulator
MKKAISLKDVAKKAGVGLGTASRVLNNHPSVKEETRQLVLNAMKELKYQPNAIARSLKIKSTKTVGVMIPDISSAFYPEIVRGIEDASSTYQYNIILCNTDLDESKEILYLNMLKEKKVDGIIFISNTIGENLQEEFENLDTPIVLISTKDYKEKFPSVTIDNVEAAYAAVDYLCKLGHKDIAMIAGEFDDPNSGIPRIEGYKRALLHNGIAFKQDLVYEGDYRYKSGYENMKKILQRGTIPTAVFAASDIMAMSAARAAMERGFKIPEDISIVGFDGIESTQFFYPSITTIEQPRYEMGYEGMTLLAKLMNGEETDSKDIVLNFKLVERESCKKVGVK